MYFLNMLLTLVTSISAVVLPRPTPIIRWNKEGGELPANRSFYENFRKTLKIIDITEADSGKYKCLAKNRLGSAHHVITVTVKGKVYANFLVYKKTRNQVGYSQPNRQHFFIFQKFD